MGIAFILPINFTLPDTGVLLEGSCGNVVRYQTHSQLWLLVATGQPIAVMYTLIMGSRGGGFGMVSAWTRATLHT